MFGPDPIIKDYMGLVSKFLTSSQTGVTSDANKPVNIVAWDTFDETIDLTIKTNGVIFLFSPVYKSFKEILNSSSSVISASSW